MQFGVGLVAGEALTVSVAEVVARPDHDPGAPGNAVYAQRMQSS